MHRITPLVCGLLIVCADASYAQIRWQTNIDEARQMAAHQNRLVLLHFWSDDCPPCRIVDRKVFTRSDVVRSIHANYIPVKIHAKRSHAVAEQYKVRGWPTDVFITPDGKELKRSVSSQDPNRYIALVDAIAAHHRVNSPVPPQAQYVQSPRREAQMPTRSAPTPSQFSQRAAQFAQGQNAQVSQGPNNQARNPQGPLAQGQFTQGQNSQPQYRQPQYSQGQTAQSPVAPTGASPRNVGSRFTTPADNSAQSQIVANPYFNSSRRPTDRAGASGNNQSPPAAPTPRFSLNNQGVNNQGPPPGQTGSVGSRYSGQSSRQPASYSPPYARAATGAAGNIGGARASGSVAPVGPRGVGGSTAPPTPTQADQAISQAPVALDGFCPVSLAVHKQWIRGNPQISWRHRGRLYHFANANELQRFQQAPDRYSPVFSGFDPVHYIEEGRLVPGRRDHGIWLGSEVFLFSSEASLSRFQSAPDRYRGGVRQAMIRGAAPRQLR